jgi:hypothetical protein
MLPRTEEEATRSSRGKTGERKQGQQHKNRPKTEGRRRLFRCCWYEEERNQESCNMSTILVLVQQCSWLLIHRTLFLSILYYFVLSLLQEHLHAFRCLCAQFCWPREQAWDTSMRLKAAARARTALAGSWTIHPPWGGQWRHRRHTSHTKTKSKHIAAMQSQPWAHNLR